MVQVLPGIEHKHQVGQADLGVFLLHLILQAACLTVGCAIEDNSLFFREGGSVTGT